MRPLLLLSLLPALVVAAPSLDLTSASDLGAATSAALTNFLTYYVPNSKGVFNEAETPWHESAMIWGMFGDYLKWSGDGQFVNTVTDALANMSFNAEQDFLNGAQASLQETIAGRWNDDMAWGSLAVISGAEIFGPSAVMPSTSGGIWYTTAQKTYDQVWEDWDETCGGGIYWSRDRGSPAGRYKSTITNVEFIAQGAQNYLQMKNETVLALAEQTVDWLFGVSGLANAETGVILDGFNVDACSTYTGSQWSYNYGQLIGAMAWMHKATANETYLTLATPFLNTALSTFFSSNNSGVLAELCEVDKSCNRDQQGFKAILARNLVYLYRETSDTELKSRIMSAIDTSVDKMVSNACDDSFRCGGNWTSDTEPVLYVRSQHVSSALLVAALGIHTSSTGSGLLTDINASALNTTPSGTGTGVAGSGGRGMVESTPLSAGAREGVVWGLVAVAMGGVVLWA